MYKRMCESLSISIIAFLLSLIIKRHRSRGKKQHTSYAFFYLFQKIQALLILHEGEVIDLALLYDVVRVRPREARTLQETTDL